MLSVVLSILFLADAALVVALRLPGYDRTLALGIQAFEWGPVPLVIVAVNPWVPRRLRAPLYLLGCALIALGAIARVWAGAHWPTDVLGGVLLGGAWAALVIYLTDQTLSAAAPIEPDATATHTA